MANHLLLMYLITLILFKITGTPLTEKGDKIYSIFNPVQTTYLYFVVVMLVTTYLGVFQQFVWKNLLRQFQPNFSIRIHKKSCLLILDRWL